MPERVKPSSPATELDAGLVRARLDALKAGGAGADDLLRAAVAEIHAASSRYDWVGVYMLEGDTLVLHNFIGAETDHTRIPVGRGVCGTAVAEDRDINVADVRELDNYIACSLDTRSEIVVLIRDTSGAVLGQLDLDSDSAAAFTDVDEQALREIADWLGGNLRPSSPRGPDSTAA